MGTINLFKESDAIHTKMKTQSRKKNPSHFLKVTFIKLKFSTKYQVNSSKRISGLNLIPTFGVGTY